MEQERRYSFVWITAIILALGLFTAASVVTYGLIKTRTVPNIVTVTGSAKKQITSDYVVWKSSFSRQSQDLATAYSLLQEDLAKVKKYLADNGLTEKDYTIAAVNTITINQILPSGAVSNAIEAYRLEQEIEVRSLDVNKVTAMSRQSTRLIEEGVEFQSRPPNYYYTKIADLKIDMLALATSDARNRAERIAENAGTSIVSVKTANMGVFQITQINSNEVSDYGINDTASIEKEIMSVVNCVFLAE